MTCDHAENEKFKCSQRKEAGIQSGIKTFIDMNPHSCPLSTSLYLINYQRPEERRRERERGERTDLATNYAFIFQILQPYEVSD